MSSTDFMPIKGWDHLELYVGNAKQAAYFYERAFGFTQTAYAGPETGMRDRASSVPAQNEVRLVLTSGLRPDSEVTRFACSHGDRVKDVALTVPSATEAYPQAVQRGGGSAAEPHRAPAGGGRDRAALGRGRARARRARLDRDVRREHPHLRQPRRLRGALPAGVQ